MMDKFCPRCGKTVDKVFGPKNVCKECYRETEEPVNIPDEIEYIRCPVCESYRIDNVWKRFDTDEKLVFDVLRQYEKEDVEMGASFRKKGNVYKVEVMMEEEKNGELIRQVENTELVPQDKQCLKCSRYQGGYFEAVLQLRGNISEDMLGELMETASELTERDRKDYIAEIEEIHGGYDIYVSSIKMVRALLEKLKQRFNLEENWSRELVGQDEGEEVYRTVVSARVGGEKTG